jgi:hypothetical protein
VHPLERPHRPTDMLRQVFRAHGRGEDKGAIHGKSIDRTSASVARVKSRSGLGKNSFTVDAVILLTVYSP